MLRARPRRLTRLGNSLLFSALTLQTLVSACSSTDSPTVRLSSEPEPESNGGSQAPSEKTISARDVDGTGEGGANLDTSAGDGTASGGSSDGVHAGSGGNGGSVSTNGTVVDATGGSGGNGGTDGTPSATTSGTGGSGSDLGESGAAGAAGAGEEVSEQFATALGDILVGASATLTPAFSPDRLRYSVLPEVGEALELAAVASEGLSITIGGEPAASAEAVPIESIATGSELEIVVSNSFGDSATYTLLILPADFPKFTVTTRTPNASEEPLYVTPSSTYSRYLAKLDNYGVPLFYKNIAGRSYDFKKHANGLMSYAFFNDSGTDEIVLDQHFNKVDVVNCVGANTDMHDFLMLENGNFIVVCTREAVRDLTSWGGSANAVLIDSIFQELSPEREVLFEWNSWDHTELEDALGRTSGDIAHANSVFVDTDGDWLISLRYLSQVLKIDSVTGDVIWRLGGARSDFEFVDDPWGGLCGQHTVSRLANGNILVFDNGTPCGPEMPDRPELTRVAEYELDEVALTATLVWSYAREGQFTEHQGSAQRLPNGNTVIGWGADENDPRFVTEVDPAGNIVFELEATVAGQSNSVTYRARRYPD